MVNDKNVTFYTVYADRKPEIRQIGSGELGGGGIRTGQLIRGQQMKSEIVKKMQSKFVDLAQTVPNEGIEFWFARDRSRKYTKYCLRYSRIANRIGP